MKRDLLSLVTVDLREAAMRLALPCDCGRQHCTLRDHIWQSTHDMTPGPRASNGDIRGRSWPSTDDDTPDRADATSGLHDRYKALLDTAQQAARNLSRFIDAQRPDRHVPLPEPISDDDYCRLHLRLGHLEDRYRGDLCRWCYDIAQVHNANPDDILIRAKERGDKITNVLIGDWLARTKIARKTKGRKVS